MEQKLYNHEILLNLLKGENHLRQIAKDLKINHMTVKRALDAMVRNNVLNVKEEGKNNIFSIKDSLEAQNAVLAAEIYKFDRFIKKHPELKREIIELKKIPAMVLVFGSYAKGNEKPDSDIDIFIETRDAKMKNAASKLNGKFSVKTGTYDKNDLLIKEIEKNHVIIKGFEVFYEKNRFFNRVA